MKQAVIGITFSHDRSKVLVVKRRDVPIWALPGGGVDVGELPEDAVRREILEETGVYVRVRRLVAELTPINRLTERTFVYECEPTKGTPGASSESLEAGFFPVTSLPALFFYVHEEWIQMALTSQETIRKPLENITYVALCRFFLRHPIYTFRFLIAKLIA